MKKITQILIFVLISLTVFAQEKKDTTAKTRHNVSISIQSELNYTNQTKLSFRNNNPNEQPGYSYSLGAIISKTIFKRFSIGTGIIKESFSTTYFSYDFYNNIKSTSSADFFFVGVPIIPDFYYSWKKVSLHFIPEIRADFLTHDIIKYTWFNVEVSYNKKILILAFPKIGVSYNINHAFSLSSYFGIKQTLSPISQTNINSPWFDTKTSFYSLSGGFGINYKL